MRTVFDILEGAPSPAGAVSRDPHIALEELGLDSLELLDIMVEIEEETGVTVLPSDLAQIKTVQDLSDYVEAHATHV